MERDRPGPPAEGHRGHLDARRVGVDFAVIAEDGRLREVIGFFESVNPPTPTKPPKQG